MGNILIAYGIIAVLWIFIVSAAAAFDFEAGYKDSAKRKTFWAVTGLVWPLVILWVIWKALRRLAITAHEGYKIIRKG